MKCYICDKDLSEKEIVYNDDLHGLEPCATCLEIIYDAAYSDGFQKEDDELVLIETFNEEKTIIPIVYSSEEDSYE